MASIFEQITDKIKQLFSSHKLSDEDRQLLRELGANDEIDQAQAFAVLLVEIALIDQKFDKEEYAFIFSFFERRFGLAPNEIRNLVHQGTNLMANLLSTEMFSNHLRETLPIEKRHDLMKVVSNLIYADNVEHGFELYLKDRLARLLGVESPELEQ